LKAGRKRAAAEFRPFNGALTLFWEERPAAPLVIDLLPDTWTGAPPALPQEVVEELAKRARDAEKKERQQRAIVRERQIPLTRVRVAHQPTFSRYVFELSELTSVSSERIKDQFLRCRFGTSNMILLVGW